MDTGDLNGFDQEGYNAGGDGWADDDRSHKISQDIAGQDELCQVSPARMELSTVQKIIKKARNVRRPMINVGDRIRIVGTREVFIEVAERLGVPVITG